MSEITQRPTFVVVPGEAQAENHPRPRVALASVPPPKPVRPQQLGLHGVPMHSDTLISVGLQGLNFAKFSSLVREHGTRVVLDLRVSSSFRSGGFSVHEVLALFEEQRIHYRRLPGLVDRRDQVVGNEQVRKRRYADFLEQQKASLDVIRKLIRQGPAVLIGWEANHADSDRAVFVDVLQRTYTERFALVVAS